MPQNESASRKLRLEQLIATAKQQPPASTPFAHLTQDAASRKQQLQSIVSQVRSNPPSPRPSRSFVPSSVPRNRPEFEPGHWYATGFHQDGKYRVEDLIAVWRGYYARRRPQAEQPPVRCPWWLRKHLLAWLKDSGHQRCEEVVAYACSRWEALRFDLDLIADEPMLNIIYGYRRSIARLMTSGEKRKWGAQTNWTGSHVEETDTEEETTLVFH